MNGLELAKFYAAVLRAWNYVKREVEWRTRRIKEIEETSSKERAFYDQYMPTMKRGLKRNRRRLRQVTKLKAGIEAALSGTRPKMKASDVDALWPAFMDREGRCKPPWKVEQEARG